MKRTTVTRLVLISMFTLAILGCNLADTIGGGNPPLEPTAPAVVYVTATPRPTLPPTAAPTATPTQTPTPEPARLTLLPCPNYPEDCPAAISANRFYEVAAPFEYTFDVPSEIKLFVSTGWGAIDMATLEQNRPYVDFFLEIDGEDFNSDLYTSVVEEPDPDVPSRMNGIIYLNVVITGWVPQQPHTIRIGYITTAPLNDGWDDYDVGFKVSRTLNVCPDGGCPGTSSSTIGGLTFTACLRAEDCPGITNVFEYINFLNYTSGEEYEVDVPYDQPLLLQTGFYMEDPAYVEASWSKLDFFFEVDGEDQLQEDFVGPGELENFMDPSVMLSGYTIGVVIDGWVKDEPHRVRYGYITTADIYDGSETREAGTAIDVRLLVNPVDNLEP